MEPRNEIIARITDKAGLMRKHAIQMCLNAGPRGVHIGPGFSIMEITATLYFGGVLRYDAKNPTWPDRDRFILSKGHGVLGFYTALAEAGYFPIELLNTFDTEESPLAGHPSMNVKLGIEASTGSLGHGLSLGVGMALSAKLNKKSYDTYVLIGDGESNEGMIWEAAMAASHFKVDNLVAVVDRNKLQADGLSRDIMDMGDMAEKWRSFGWEVAEVDGHNVSQLLDAFHRKHRPKGKPYVIVAYTTKGKGVNMFENNKDWHHYRNFRPDQAKIALSELGFKQCEEDGLLAQNK
jgi:transketolase